jgi:hypothetical protein
MCGYLCTSLRANVYIYTYIHIHKCTYIHIYIFIFIHIHRCTYIHAYINIYIYIYINRTVDTGKLLTEYARNALKTYVRCPGGKLLENISIRFQVVILSIRHKFYFSRAFVSNVYWLLRLRFFSFLKN